MKAQKKTDDKIEKDIVKIQMVIGAWPQFCTFHILAIIKNEQSRSREKKSPKL